MTHPSPSDEAVALGAAAVAAFADQHRLRIPPELREDLARDVLSAGGQAVAAVNGDEQPAE